MYELAQTNRFTGLTEQETFAIDGGTPKIIIVVVVAPPAKKAGAAVVAGVAAGAAAAGAAAGNLVNRGIDWLFGRN